jgi:hypothetical protein
MTKKHRYNSDRSTRSDVTTPANKLTGIYGVAPTDCSPNPVLLILHNYIFQVKKHENHENQHLPLCSFVTVIRNRRMYTINLLVGITAVSHQLIGGD